ncbi:MAG TPA: N-acetyltransferase [Treponema sp.]|nr:N-acetyltransferase [Treponema sp.]
MDFTLENLTFRNCSKAYEIDRSDIPEAFVDDVPVLIATLKFGFENKLKGHAFLITKNGRAVGTILLGEGLYCDTDPKELMNKPFYRLVFFVLDRKFRGKGAGSEILEKTIKKVYEDFGKRPIVLGVHKDNEKAERFYLRNGFTRTSCMDGDDCIFIRAENSIPLSG